MPPFEALIASLADSFPECEGIAESDLPPLSHADIRVVIQYDTSAFNRDELIDEADIYGTVLYSTDAERIMALGIARHQFLNAEARRYATNAVNEELDRRAREVHTELEEEFS